MDSPHDHAPCEITLTAPDRQWLQGFVRGLVEDRLAAAAHVDQMHTTYRWRGVVEDGLEARATLHSVYGRFPEIAHRVRAQHPFEVACLIVKAFNGSPPYLEWVVSASVSAQ